jgi:hypothetical protein
MTAEGGLELTWPSNRGCSSMVEQKPSKLMTRVRFPSPAPIKSRISSIGGSQKFHRDPQGTPRRENQIEPVGSVRMRARRAGRKGHGPGQKTHRRPFLGRQRHGRRA